MDEAERDAARNLDGSASEAAAASDTIKLLTVAAQEIVARASLCNVQVQPHTTYQLTTRLPQLATYHSGDHRARVAL